MDTSKEYIKMCDCDEVSENRKVGVEEQKDGRVHYEICLKDGDFFYTESGYNSYSKKMEWGIEVKGTTIYNPYAYWCKKGEPIVWTISIVGFDEGESYGAKRFVWLPRQDQTQEMFGWIETSVPSLTLAIRFAEFCGINDKEAEGSSNVSIRKGSLEVLWLAYYMYEKHQKEWTGEKWIKLSK